MIGNWNYGTGRRKSSVARVFIKKGSGQGGTVSNPDKIVKMQLAADAK